MVSVRQMEMWEGQYLWAGGLAELPMTAPLCR